MGIGRTIGTIGGGIGGFFVGGPAGAMLGAAGGGMLGGAFEDEANRDAGSPKASAQTTAYGGLGANAEADRASQLGATGARDTRFLGRQLGADADFGQYRAQNAENAAAARAGGLYGDAAASMGRAGAANADQQGARGDSMAAIGRLRSFYEQGPGPSAAQAQLRQGQDSAARQAMSVAATGGGGAAARRAALRASAAGNQQTNQAASTLRAQEAAQWQQTKLGAMGAEQQALSGVRAGDMGAMGQHYGAAGQQYGAAGQASAVGVGHANVGLGYGGQRNQGVLGSEGMAIGQNQFGEQQRSGILGNQLAADTNRYGADKGVTVGMANVAQRDRAADMAMTGSLIGAGVNMMGNQQTSDVRAKENIRPTSAASLVERLDAAEAMAAGDTGARNGVRMTRDIRAEPGTERTALSGEEEDQFRDWARKGNVRDVDHPDAHYDYRGAYLKGIKPGPDAHWSDEFKQHGHPTFSVESKYSRGSTDGGYWDGDKFMPSDVRVKENVRPVSAASLVSRVGGPDLRGAGGYSYDYKNASYGPDNQVGPMAQELERTDAAGAVSTGPDGMKSVDPGRLTMTNTSAIAEQQRRLDRLESMAADEVDGNFHPQGAATNGQRIIRKVEAIEGRRMGGDEKRRMATFGNIGSIKPEDEEYIRASSPRTSAASGSRAGRAR